MNNTFITPKKCDNFISLRGSDLQDLLLEMEKYLLEYRNTLNLPRNLTFGVELEYEGISKKVTDKFIKDNLDGWTSKTDGSLFTGGEITSPVMIDNIKYWEELKKVCKNLSKRNADTSHNAGGHIHIGVNILDTDVIAWRIFLKVYTAYENVIFRFVYGDKLNARENLFRYASPKAESLFEGLNFWEKIDTFENIFEVIYQSKFERYSAINFNNVNFYNLNSKNHKNTIEFRSPNASTNEVVWQNNINTFAKMLVSSKDKVMDEDFLNYKLKHEFLPYSKNEYIYNNINLKNALEFVDLIFDNNLDKVYFLKQYLKNYQENYGSKTVVKAKRFVK